jgi:hypothetical protein
MIITESEPTHFGEVISSTGLGYTQPGSNIMREPARMHWQGTLRHMSLGEAEVSHSKRFVN